MRFLTVGNYTSVYVVFRFSFIACSGCHEISWILFKGRISLFLKCHCLCMKKSYFLKHKTFWIIFIKAIYFQVFFFHNEKKLFLAVVPSDDQIVLSFKFSVVFAILAILLQNIGYCVCSFGWPWSQVWYFPWNSGDSLSYLCAFIPWCDCWQKVFANIFKGCYGQPPHSYFHRDSRVITQIIRRRSLFNYTQIKSHYKQENCLCANNHTQLWNQNWVNFGHISTFLRFLFSCCENMSCCT